jgi:ABC-2 type transport system ATP-binding protein
MSSAPPTSAPVLSAHELTLSYGGRTAVRGVSLELLAGQLLVIIGPNGAGKTTLLSMLAGVLTPASGELRGASGRQVGWVPQQPALYSKLSVAENLRLFARLERLSDPEAAVERMLEQTGLAARAAEQVGRLSGGNRQRVNIAIGLLSEPSVLLLDEPTSSLDPAQRERLWDFIGRLVAGGTSVVTTTHNVVEAERLADRVLVLAEGERLFLGSTEALVGEVAEASQTPRDFESAFVAYLHARGH